MLNKIKLYFKNKLKILLPLFSLFSLLIALFVPICNSENSYNKVSAETLNLNNIINSSSILGESNYSWSINSNNEIIANSNRLAYYPQFRVRVTNYMTSINDYLVLSYKFNWQTYLYIENIYLVYGYPQHSAVYRFTYNGNTDISVDKGGDTLLLRCDDNNAFDNTIIYRYLILEFNNVYAQQYGLNFDNNIVGSANLQKLYLNNGEFSNDTIENAKNDVINNDYKGQNYNEIYSNGYDTGYGYGVAFGTENATNNVIQNNYHNMDYNTIYQLGYSEGYTSGSASNYSLVTEISELVNLPFTFANNSLNFEILGLNMYSLFTACITLLLLIWVIKKAIK